jgi:hypothetical protein
MRDETNDLPAPEEFTVHAPAGGWTADPVGKAQEVDEAVAAYLRTRKRRPAVAMQHETWKVLAPHLTYNQRGSGAEFKTFFNGRPDAVVFVDEEA